MECDTEEEEKEEKINGDEHLGKLHDDDNDDDGNDESVSGAKNVSEKTWRNEKQRKRRRRRRRRPRTKAVRRRIREKIEVALCTSDSPIHNILERNENCQVSAPLSSVISSLKLDSEEYQKLSYEALIGIGNLSNLFSIVGDTRDTLRILLKSSELEDSATVVYIDNLPRGCEVDTLERWASKFGTVVNVHPILEQKAMMNKSATTGELLLSTSAKVSASLQGSTSADSSGKFFQCAFIKFLDEHSPREFIKFHQLLRKNTAKRRRKKLRLLRIQAMKRSAKALDSNSRIKKKLRKKKHKPEEAKVGSESRLQETSKVVGRQMSSTNTMKTEVNAVEEPTMRIYSSDEIARVKDGSHKRRRKRKKELSYEAQSVTVKKSKSATSAEKSAMERLQIEHLDRKSSEENVREAVGLTTFTTKDYELNASEETNLIRAVSDTGIAAKKAGIQVARLDLFVNDNLMGDVKDTKKKAENEEEEMKIIDEPTVVKNILKLTKMDVWGSSKKTFRDVGTDVPARFLLKQNGVSKKRKRVHRQKRRDEKSKNRVLHPKKYFHDMQVYSLTAFQKLRAKYLELQRQQMIQLKADLKKRTVSCTLPGLSKKERKKKRGRSRLVLRAQKLREEDEDSWHCIPQNEDKTANA